MAKFERRKRYIELDFGNDCVWHIDVPTPEVANKLNVWATEVENLKDNDIMAVAKKTEELTDMMLGAGALQKIKDQAFSGDTLYAYDYLDIAAFIIQTINDFIKNTSDEFVAMSNNYRNNIM